MSNVLSDKDFEFIVRNRFKSLEQRCVNGSYNNSSTISKNKQQQSYIKKGTRLEFGYEEFLKFMYENKEKFDELYFNKEYPTISRIDFDGHYSLDNIVICSRHESFSRRYKKECKILSEYEKSVKKAQNDRIFDRIRKKPKKSVDISEICE